MDPLPVDPGPTRIIGCQQNRETNHEFMTRLIWMATLRGKCVI